jgi:Xaa-Pro aminopeptidase
MNLPEIQEAIRDQGFDGWLFFDHHRRDPLAYRILNLAPEQTPTRRWYYLIPRTGEPQKLVHRIESFVLDKLPGEKLIYSSWTSQAEALGKLLSGRRRVAMQYSPNCANFHVSMVDAGTVELVRGLGVEVVSSADLLQYFEARWSEDALESHLEAGRRVDEARRLAFRFAGDRLNSREDIDEFSVQRFIRESFLKQGLVTDHGPIVAVNENASNPHYEPTEHVSRPIRRGDVLLIDLWAKLDKPGSVYYDITWTGYCGLAPPDEVAAVFDIVREARDSAIKRVVEAVNAGESIRGYQVDDVARGHIEKRGYGEFFVHRTGHSIGEDVHGAGANMDNLETHDERRIIPRTCFSIEPGIYLPAFGIRSEVNVFVDEKTARVTGEKQERLVLV